MCKTGLVLAHCSPYFIFQLFFYSTVELLTEGETKNELFLLMMFFVCFFAQVVCIVLAPKGIM